MNATFSRGMTNTVRQERSDNCGARVGDLPGDQPVTLFSTRHKVVLNM